MPEIGAEDNPQTNDIIINKQMLFVKSVKYIYTIENMHINKARTDTTPKNLKRNKIYQPTPQNTTVVLQ